MKQNDIASKALDYIQNLTPQERIRISFNLWQFAKDLKEKAQAYDENWTNATRTTA